MSATEYIDVGSLLPTRRHFCGASRVRASRRGAFLDLMQPRARRLAASPHPLAAKEAALSQQKRKQSSS